MCILYARIASIVLGSTVKLEKGLVRVALFPANVNRDIAQPRCMLCAWFEGVCVCVGGYVIVCVCVCERGMCEYVYVCLRVNVYVCVHACTWNVSCVTGKMIQFTS